MSADVMTNTDTGALERAAREHIAQIDALGTGALLANDELTASARRLRDALPAEEPEQVILQPGELDGMDAHDIRRYAMGLCDSDSFADTIGALFIAFGERLAPCDPDDLDEPSPADDAPLGVGDEVEIVGPTISGVSSGIGKTGSVTSASNGGDYLSVWGDLEGLIGCFPRSSVRRPGYKPSAEAGDGPWTIDAPGYSGLCYRGREMDTQTVRDVLNESAEREAKLSDKLRDARDVRDRLKAEVEGLRGDVRAAEAAYERRDKRVRELTGQLEEMADKGWALIEAFERRPTGEIVEEAREAFTLEIPF